MLLMGVTSGDCHEGHGSTRAAANGCAEGRQPTVRILEGIFSPHVNNLQRALGRATERQALLTNNLANVNTPGYKRQDVDFNIVLESELTPKAPIGPEAAARRASESGRQTSDSSLRLDGNNVDLEQEVFSLAETELRYEALSEMAASYFQGLKSAIREGR